MAQLVARSVRDAEVVGSSPITLTIPDEFEIVLNNIDFLSIMWYNVSELIDFGYGEKL